MPRSMFLVLPLTAGMLSGCTTLVRSVDWIRAVMTKEEPNEDINNYGAFFTSPLPTSPELASRWPGQFSDSIRKQRGASAEECSGWNRH